MRNINTRCKTTKKKLNKCKNVFYAFNDIQFRYGLELELNEDIVEIKSNVRLIGFELGDHYSSDFLCVKKNGQVMVRECVYKDKLLKPLNIKLLDLSRNYWLSRGVKDWGIVINE